MNLGKNISKSFSVELDNLFDDKLLNLMRAKVYHESWAQFWNGPRLTPAPDVCNAIRIQKIFMNLGKNISERVIGIKF